MKIGPVHLFMDKTLARMFASRIPQDKREVTNTQQMDVHSSYLSRSGNVDVPYDSDVVKKKGYSYLANMAKKNGTVYGLITTREHAIIRRGWIVQPASETRRDVEIAEFVTRVVNELHTPFTLVMHNIYQAWYYGWSLQQKVWGADSTGKYYVITDLQDKPVDDLEIVCETTGKPVAIKKRSYSTQPNQQFPIDAFVYAAFDSTAKNPYGYGLLDRCYWHDFFMRNTWKFWAVYLEKYGSPTTVGKVPLGTSTTERDALLTIIETIQSRTGVVLPENQMLEYLEATRSDSSLWKSFCDEHRLNIQLIILGQTLTSTAGTSGSRALGEVQSTVKDHIIDSDCELLFSILQHQFVEPLVNMNYSGVKKYPTIMSPTKEDTDLESLGRIMMMLYNMKMPIPTEWAYNKFGIPIPVGGESVLELPPKETADADPKTVEGQGSPKEKANSDDSSTSGNDDGTDSNKGE